MEKSRTLRFALSLMLALPALSAWHPVLAQSSDEYTLKAALNYNFAKYTLWPASEAADHVVLCYFNESFRHSFEPLVGRPIAGKTIRIRQLRSSQDAGDCHLLFLDGANRDLLDEINEAVGEKAVLTVADYAGFTDAGGMIEILTVDNKLRFKVNLARLQRSGISLSSQVLALAMEVNQ